MPSSFTALYYDGRVSRPYPVMVSPSGSRLRVDGDGIALDLSLDALRIPSRLGNTRRIIDLPDGAQLHSDDNDAIDALTPALATRWEHRLERAWPLALASVLIVACAVTGFFLVGLPALADRVAHDLPVQSEQFIGKGTLPMLAKAGLLDESTLDITRQAELTALFEQLASADAATRHASIRFADWGKRVNAIALPGGEVIMSDALVNGLAEDRLIAAIMAHELGHISQRHAVRKLLRSGSALVLLSLVMGDGSLSLIGAGAPMILLDSHYSRGFETEADTHAFALLADRGQSPLDFADAMQRLREQVGGDTGGGHFISTHPPDTARIEAARAAAGAR